MKSGNKIEGKMVKNDKNQGKGELLAMEDNWAKTFTYMYDH